MQPLVKESIPQALQAAQQLLQQKKLREAEHLYRQILAIAPEQPQATHGLGIIAMSVNRPDIAVQLFTKSAGLQSKNPMAYLDLGNALLMVGRMNDAVVAYQKVVELQPEFAGAYSNLGIALHEVGRVEESLEAFRRAADLSPDLPEAQNNLGTASQQLGRFDDAIDAYRRALALRPDAVDIHNNLAVALKDSCQIREGIEAARAAVKMNPKWPIAHSNLVAFLALDPDCDARSIFEEHRRWNQQHAEPLAAGIRAHDNDRDPNRRLRVGYVSPDFREHSVAYFSESLIGGHDAAAVEVFCYADLQRREDPISRRIQSKAHQWRNVTGQSDQQVIDSIRKDRIDILVDLAGHTLGNRLLVFARKPAPVQVTYLGYPNTTGMTAIDYRFTDALADPPGLTDSFNSEKLMRLPETFLCYSPPANAPEVSEAPCANGNPVTFGSFNAIAKVNSQLVALWAKILQQSPGSRLLIKSGGLENPGTRRLIFDWFAQNGITADRIELIGKIPSHSGHLGAYSRIDIGLDTFPYHGTTTTCEAMWMGIPVITLEGQTHVSRVGVSLLNNVGLGQLVATNAEAYVEIATSLAADRARLIELRRGMRDRMRRSVLMDAPRFARAVENAYRDLWRRWCGKDNLSP